LTLRGLAKVNHSPFAVSATVHLEKANRLLDIIRRTFEPGMGDDEPHRARLPEEAVKLPGRMAGFS
jgi:hypothetical protein